MEYIPLSFLAGILTILAPCVLPLLPIIIGGSLTDKNPWRPFIITVSLAVSIVLFTLALKVSTAFIDIPQSFWKWFSGGIVLLFAITLLFPTFWEKLATGLRLGNASQGWLSKSGQKKGVLGMILIGAALGPVFASCSPTYFLILGTVLPQNFFVGLVNLLVYAGGLSLMMFAIAYTGQRFMSKLKVAADPHGWFKKGLGILFLIIGLGIINGYDKKFEAWVVQQGWTGITELEEQLIDNKVDSIADE